MNSNYGGGSSDRFCGAIPYGAARRGNDARPPPPPPAVQLDLIDTHISVTVTFINNTNATLLPFIAVMKRADCRVNLSKNFFTRVNVIYIYLFDVKMQIIIIINIYLTL